jgi:hypothetical protein
VDRSKYLEGIRGKAIFSGLVEGVWVAIVLVWPVLKWVLIDQRGFQLSSGCGDQR